MTTTSDSCSSLYRFGSIFRTKALNAATASKYSADLFWKSPNNDRRLSKDANAWRAIASSSALDESVCISRTVRCYAELRETRRAHEFFHCLHIERPSSSVTQDIGFLVRVVRCSLFCVSGLRVAQNAARRHEQRRRYRGD